MHDKIHEYIKTSQALILERKETLFYNVPVYIKDPLPESLSLNSIFRKIMKVIPRHFVSNIYSIYIGNIAQLREREVNALYDGNAIYISNQQENEKDLIDDIVHEISHALEEQFSNQVYGDGKLEEEFLRKRKRLYDILKAYGLDPVPQEFQNPNYQESFDLYLYKEIGYKKLNNFTRGLFPSNYAVTSLREYFGIGFENFLLKDKEYLRKTCPILYNKIKGLYQTGEK